jgi:hypothetical protein
MKSLYILQAYSVGSKKAKSVGLVIPRGVADGYNINASTVLLLRTDYERKMITLQTLNEIMGNEAQKNFQTSIEHVSPESQ